jgi:CheY-like chemotaxis protein
MYSNSYLFCFDLIFLLDVLSNRKMLNLILRNQGIQHITQCVDGTEALETLTAKGIDHFDLIFMDSVMPHLTGPAATVKLREMGYQHLLLGLTGNALETDVEYFEAAGADAILIKPLKGEYLKKVLLYLERHGCVSTRQQRPPTGKETIEGFTKNNNSSIQCGNMLLKQFIFD